MNWNLCAYKDTNGDFLCENITRGGAAYCVLHDHIEQCTIDDLIPCPDGSSLCIKIMPSNQKMCRSCDAFHQQWYIDEVESEYRDWIKLKF